jgi:DNA polymerase-3 subunit beta
LKFRCERDSLLEALNTTARAVNAKSSLPPAFSGIRLEIKGDTALLASSDMEVSIQTTLDVTGLSNGVGIFPGKLSVDIVRAFSPGSVTIELSDDDAIFSSGRSQFNVRPISSDEFPNIAQVKGEKVVVQARELGEAFSQIIRAASTDESKPILTGVYMVSEKDGLRIVATDSYRLAIKDLPGNKVLEPGKSVLIPARALSELQKLLLSSTQGQSAYMVLGDNEVSFEIDQSVLSTRLLAGKFPNYEQLIPNAYPNSLQLNKTNILDALKRMKLLIRDNTTPIRISLSAKEIEISVVTPEIGQAKEVIDGEYSGEDSVIAFNPTYLAEGLEAINSNELVIETIDSSKPATVRSLADENFQYLLMPVRVS